MGAVVACLIYVAVAAMCGVIFGMAVGGIGLATAIISLLCGTVAAVAAFLQTPSSPHLSVPDSLSPFHRYRYLPLCFLAVVFAIFAVRSFCWLYYFDGDEIKIQSPNNLGDLGLHLTYIKTFANGVPLWPDSPLFVSSKLRYPAGIDLFNGLLTAVGFSLRGQLVVTGLVASAITCYLFYRWAGAFGVAGFLFNGGVIGYHFLHTLAFLDYQGASNISWKSIPLSMFVTQRGLLYAIPAGLLLLWQWRTKFGDDAVANKQALPLWMEFVLYATLPLFHVHTFLALNVVVVTLFLLRPAARRPLVLLAAGTFIPASFFVWLITDNLHAKSVFGWHIGWTQNSGEFAMPFLQFWFVNFGFLLPLVAALIGLVAVQDWRTRASRRFELSFDLTTLLAAVVIFTITVMVKTAPWEWDNNKILIWAYFLVLPVLWTRMIVQWPLIARTGACVLLFFSGFVSLFGGLAAGADGFGFASRSEIDQVADAVKPLPITARFGAFPTYNHPLLLNGRKVVCGYPGHLWTQGIADGPVTAKLQAMMLGRGDWRDLAGELKVRYIFWGPEEQRNYGASTRPWEQIMQPVAKGTWGAIYDLGPPR